MQLQVAQERAKEIFDGLDQIWDLDNAKAGHWLYEDYWKCGNTLDAVLTYLALNPAGINVPEKTKSLIDLCSTNVFEPRYQHKIDTGSEVPWRDDFGWWGLAWVNALQHANELRIDSDKYKEIRALCMTNAINCWKILNDSALDSLAYYDMQKKNGSKPDELERLQYAGAGYTPWNNKTISDYENARKNNDEFTCVPNTVTVTGFCALSLALYRLTNDTSYSNALANSLYWCNELLKDAHLISQTYLVYETANPAVHKPWCNDVSRGWTADQGAFIDLCIKASKVAETPKYAYLKPILNNLIQTVLAPYGGTKHILIGDDLILREYKTVPLPVDGDWNWGNFNDNYATGPGVFARYVGRFYNEVTSGYNDAKKKLATVIDKSAEGAWQHRKTKDASQSYEKILCWYMDITDKTCPYEPYYGYAGGKDKPNQNIWDFALQSAGLDLYTAQIKILEIPN